jgi:hypothetical protein
MPATSITGADFTVTVASTAYSSQVTTGTITTTPTVVRTKTLDSVNFVQTDNNGTASIEFLYDENTGLFDALQTAIAGATSVALTIDGGAGSWTFAAAWIESAEVSYEAAGVAMASASFTGSVAFA